MELFAIMGGGCKKNCRVRQKWERRTFFRTLEKCLGGKMVAGEGGTQVRFATELGPIVISRIKLVPSGEWQY